MENEPSMMLRYKDLACRAPLGDIRQALNFFHVAPGKRQAQVDETQDWLARNYQAMIDQRLTRKLSIFFGMGVAILYANEIYEGREQPV